MKNLETFDDIPAIPNEEIFQRAFKTAELAALNPIQRDQYEQSLIQYRDLKSALETAVEESKIEIAKNAIKKGFDSETSEISGPGPKSKTLTNIEAPE